MDNKIPEVKEASLEDLAILFQKLSGKNEMGESKAVMSYQSFEINEPEDSVNKMTIHTIAKATCDLSFDKMNPGFVTCQIAFGSPDDTELKLLWGRLQRHMKNEQKEPEKTWIFYIHLMERGSISDDFEDDTVVVGHIMNPLMFYLTRETPQVLAEDFVSNGELVGGNVIKMLIPLQLFSYEVSNDYDTGLLKAEARREDEARDYLDNYEAPKWSE